METSTPTTDDKPLQPWPSNKPTPEGVTRYISPGRSDIFVIDLRKLGIKELNDASAEIIDEAIKAIKLQLRGFVMRVEKTYNPTHYWLKCRYRDDNTTEHESLYDPTEYPCIVFEHTKEKYRLFTEKPDEFEELYIKNLGYKEWKP
jgi:hypothetical protein